MLQIALVISTTTAAACVKFVALGQYSTARVESDNECVTSVEVGRRKCMLKVLAQRKGRNGNQAQ